MSKGILWCIGISIFIFIVVSFLLWWFVPCEILDNGKILTNCESIVNVYHASIRGYVFSGFLSMGAFMFSLMTFVVTNLKEKLFDTKQYIDKYVISITKCQGKKAYPEEIIKRQLYSPLVQLTGFICCAIYTSIITSVFQFTLGFSNNIILVAVCGYSAVLTLCFFCVALRFLWLNLKDWLDTEDRINLPSEYKLSQQK